MYKLKLLRDTGVLHRHRPGFALVSSMTILILLVVIALGVITLSTRTSKLTSQEMHIAEAKANARMALSIAIAQLQKHTGPDTRVTASVSVQNSATSNPYWVSVYKTRPDEDLDSAQPVSGKYVVDHHEGERFLTDIRSNGDVEPVSYLVSGGDKAGFNPNQSMDDGNSVLLLNTSDESLSVRAPFVKVDDSNIAYWVSDNSTKIVYNRKSPYQSSGSSTASADNEDYYAATVLQEPKLSDVKLPGSQGESPYSDYDNLDSTSLDKAITLGTSRLVFDDLSDDQLKQSFHLITSDSASVFANTIIGGLKQDLTPFIERGDMNPSGDDSNKNLASLLEADPIIRGDHHNMTSPRFGVFKDWADLRFKLSSNRGNASLPAQTYSDSFVQNFWRSPSLRRRDLTKVQANYVQAVVVESSLGWDFSSYTDSSGVEKLRTHLYPRLVLWNPYNVTLEERSYVMMAKLPLSCSFAYRNSSIGIRFSTLLGMGSEMVGFVTEPVTLEPGECKVFSPDMDNSKGANLYGKARKFSSSDFSSNVLTAENPPGAESFYWDSNYSLATAETAANRNRPYGLNGQQYSDQYSNGGDEYVVLETRGSLDTSLNESKLASSNKYETVSHFLAQPNAQSRKAKWYITTTSPNSANGSSYFRKIEEWSTGRMPARLWRRGVRLRWYDESTEVDASRTIVMNKEVFLDRLTSMLISPLLATSNLRGGQFNHPNALGARLHYGWQNENLNSHRFFLQPTSTQEYQQFFPPSPVGRPMDGYPERVVLFDIPRENPGIFSLGQFQHAQFSYLPWHPSYALGSSYATEQSDLDATALRSSDGPFSVTDTNRWKAPDSGSFSADGLIQRGSSDSVSSRTHGDEVLIYDISYELNEAIWDRFMLSGIPYRGGLNSRSFNWDGATALPVSSYKLRSDLKDEYLSQSSSTPSYPYYHSAEALMNHGALNVNCDNKEVWKAYLMGLQGMERPNIQDASGVSNNDVPFSRSVLAAAGGSSSILGAEDDKAWNAFRVLTESEIDELAEQIVKVVKERGPFLSTADFINRRLSKDDSENRKGALQAAIDTTSINQVLQEADDSSANDKRLDDIPTLLNRPEHRSATLPGYLSQNDLITVLAPHLVARGDTFTIRAYGESRDSKGKLMATAYCEAVVQRQPEYVDSSDDAVEPVRIYNETDQTWELNKSSGSGNGGLTKVNLKFGRKYVVTKFRWLSKDEI